MNKVKGLIVAVGLSAFALAAVACSNNGEAATGDTTAPPAQTSPAVGTSPTAPAPAVQPAPVVNSLPPATAAGPAIGAPAVAVQEPGPVSAPPNTPVQSLPATAPEASVYPKGAPAPPAVAAVSVAGAPSYSGAPLADSANSSAGIWVSGEGKMALEPDLALLNLGVEATAKTVAEAREEAANAMDAIVAALRGHSVADRDIQTRFFNISPQYEWMEVIDNGIRSSKQVLVGYRVSNSASVKIRDMDAVGPIIDDVAAAGGDATRINGINFTVEDTSALMVQLREDAVADALAKADQFARLTGVGLGRLMYISESNGSQPQIRAFEDAEFRSMSMAAAAPSTSVSGGELEISMFVQAVFAIQ
ncbi:MAG: DUF541 domain-containing protein [SAR202 cluster bacterium]|nr:SIMPL domain-containing protein [SAR202 cluster bacterium]MDP6663623.1 SIMPL domain-containing protein [SAR202 cluster bacterium]MQG59344.1 DUF541 domain-containing protein [SAR202 cluster bacterium]MQG67295.1 DUF541 domain-containing protein [SAR202 cluster bacterium]